MRKVLPITISFLLLTFSMTQSAIAQKQNVITNQTTETLYVVYSTKFGAEAPIPAGYRTQGWKTIAAGQQKTFWAYDPHKIYFQIWKGSDRIKPRRATQTFAFWINRKANFNIVTRQEINASITRGQLLYSSHDTSLLTHSDGFMRYNNGSRITVTNAWVDVDNVIKETQIFRWKSVDTLRAHTAAVNTVAWDPDGARLASGSDDKTVRIWSFGTEIGTVLRHTLTEHTGPVFCAAWDKNAPPTLASVGLGRTWYTWDGLSGKLKSTGQLRAEGSSILSVAWYSGGTVITTPGETSVDVNRNDLIVTGFANGTVEVWSIEPHQKLETLRGHTDAVNAVAWNPDGTHIASGSDDKTVRVWNAQTGALIESLRGHTDAVNAVAWNPDGTHIASGSDDKTIRVWDAEVGELLETLGGHTGAVNAVDWSPDGTHIASGSDDKTIQMWEHESAGANDEVDEIPAETIPVHIPDPGLRSSIEDALGKAQGSAITQADMETLTKLNASFRDVSSIIGLELAINLTSLDLGNNTIVDVSPLKNLINLESLSLWHNQIEDLSPLANLKNLESLYLSHNQIEDLSPLANLKNLTELDLSYNQIADFSPIAGLIPNLTLYNNGGQRVAETPVEVPAYESARIILDRFFKGYDVAFSPDGNTIAVATRDYLNNPTLRLWDVNTGRFFQTLTGLLHEGYYDSFESVSFSPDGTLLATGSGRSDKTVRLWDVNTGGLLQTLRGHTAAIRSVWFSPDGNTLATASSEATRLWDVNTGGLLQTFGYRGSSVSSVSFSPDGTLLATGGGWSDKTVRLWDVNTGGLLQTLRGHTAAIESVSFSPDGNTLATGSGWPDETIRLWDVNTGSLLHTLRGHTAAIRSVSFSPDGHTLVSGSEDKTIRLWDVRTGRHLQTLEGIMEHIDFVGRVAFSPDGRTIASADRGQDQNDLQIVRLWRVEGSGDVMPEAGSVRITDSKIPQSVKPKDLRPSYTLDHWRRYRTVSWSPDGTLLATGLRLWDPHTGDLVRELDYPREYPRSLSWSPDGTLLAIGNQIEGNFNEEDGVCQVCIWDPHTGDLVRTLDPFKWADNNTVILIQDVSWSPDGTLLAIAGARYTEYNDHDEISVLLFNLHTGQLVRTIELPISALSISWSPDGTLLAVGSRDGSTRIWDPHTGKHVRTLFQIPSWDTPTSFPAYVGSVSWSPDGALIASGIDTPEIRISDAHTGALVHTLNKGMRLASDGPIPLSWSPDGTMLAVSTYASPAVYIWNRNTEEFEWPKTSGDFDHDESENNLAISGAISLSWSPDGTMFAAAAANYHDSRPGGIYLWTTERVEQPNIPQYEPPSGISGPYKNFLAFKLPIDFNSFEESVMSPDGQLLAIIDKIFEGVSKHRSIYRRRFILVDTNTEQILREWEFPAGIKLNLIAFSPDGRHLVYAEDDTVKWLDTNTGETSKTLDIPSGNAYDLNSDGRMLCVRRHSDGKPTEFEFWDVNTGQLLRTIIDSRLMYYSDFTWSLDGRMFAVGNTVMYGVYYITAVDLWDVNTGKFLRTITDFTPSGYRRDITSFVFDANGHLLTHSDVLHGGSNDVLTLWDPNTGKPLRTAELGAYISSVSPDRSIFTSRS